MDFGSDINFDNRIADLDNRPSMSSDDLKAKFDENPEILREALNKLIGKLNEFNGEVLQNLSTGLSKKVDKVDGKGLSEADFTNAEKEKLESLYNYDDADLRNEVSKKADSETVNSALSLKADKTTVNVELAKKANKTEVDTALNGKVNKVEGKGLSTNDYTSEEKNKLESLYNYDDSGIRTELLNKVDKEDGKGLSANDFTDEEKQKLKGLYNYDDTEIKQDVSDLEITIKNKTDKSQVANVLKGNVSGEIVTITDISPIEHDMAVKVSSDTITDLSTVTLKAMGKNIINIPDIDSSYNVKNKVWSIPCYIPHTITISAQKNNMVVQDSTGADKTIWHIRVTYKDGTQLYILNSAEPFKTTFKSTAENPIIDISYRGVYIVDGYYSNFQVELGSAATEYEPYIEPTIHNVNEDGVVEGIKSIYPNTMLMTDTGGVLIECEYNRDINKAFAELQNAIISLGGNV